MPHRLVVLALATSLVSPALCQAQTPIAPVAPETSVPTIGRPGDFVALPQAPLFGNPPSREAGDGFWAPFKAIPGDYVRFFSADTMRVVGLGGALALAGSALDERGIEAAQAHLKPQAFQSGNVGGQFYIQAGASFGLYTVARLVGDSELAAVGADLVRAQVLSQGIVQIGKMLTTRPRPDSSNNHSLPSGHTASAVATATVLQRHYGWKVGLPAYGFGAYVAAARMSANKHHLSDVLLGAAIGVAAGRTVTVGVGGTKFDMGVAPTVGGAAITFTRR